MGTNTKLHRINIAYSNEIWNPGKTEQEKINRIMDNIIKRILMVPQSTPREALYIETGLLDPEAIRLKNRVLMEHRITNGNSQRMKKLITNNTTTSKWAEETKKAKEQLEIDERDVKGEKTTVKNRITNRVKDWFKAKIEKESNEKSKIQHLLEGLTGWEPQKRARYMNKLTRQQASTIFKARTRMLPVKNNYRNKYRNHTCRACGELVETQKHVLEDCEVLHIVGEYKVYNKEIFSDNPNKLRTTATNIQNLMHQLNNIAENEVTTTPKQPKTKQTSTARQKKGSSSPATRGSTQWWWWSHTGVVSDRAKIRRWSTPRWIMESYDSAASSSLSLLTSDQNKKLNLFCWKYLRTTLFICLSFQYVFVFMINDRPRRLHNRCDSS